MSTQPSSSPLLVVDDIAKNFGGIKAVDGVTFELEAGTTLGIIGPNGAGKTALLNCISGVYRINQGSILFDGQPIHGLRPDRIARRGIVRTFQSTEYFADFGVLDYVLLGRSRFIRSSTFASAFSWPTISRGEKREAQVAMDALDRCGLAEFASERLNELPYGVQKRIDVARVIATEGRVALLDEPTSGTTTNERELISEAIEMLAESGTAILLIDHDVTFVGRHCAAVLALNSGKSLAVGSPEEVLAVPAVAEAFLGLVV